MISYRWDIIFHFTPNTLYEGTWHVFDNFKKERARKTFFAHINNRKPVNCINCEGGSGIFFLQVEVVTLAQTYR
jgi:hypothetical protein